MKMNEGKGNDENERGKINGAKRLKPRRGGKIKSARKLKSRQKQPPSKAKVATPPKDGRRGTQKSVFGQKSPKSDFLAPILPIEAPKRPKK